MTYIYNVAAKGEAYTKNAALDMAAYRIFQLIIKAVKKEGGVSRSRLKTPSIVYAQLQNDNSMQDMSNTLVERGKINDDTSHHTDDGVHMDEAHEFNRLITLLELMGLELPIYTIENR